MMDHPERGEFSMEQETVYQGALLEIQGVGHEAL